MKSFLSVTLLVFAIQTGFSQQNITTLPAITVTKALNDKVFFVASHGQYGIELFVSDGSSGNFKVLKDINPGYSNSTPSELTIFNDQLFFIAYSPDYGQSLWKSDGTVEGTQLVYGMPNAEPANLMVFKNKLYFTTTLGSILRTDGTSSGTQSFYQSEYTWGRIMTVVKTKDYIYFSPDGRTIYRDDGSSRIDFLAPLSWEDVSFRNLFPLENTLVVVKSSTYDNVIRVYSINNDALGNGHEEDDWVLIKKLDAPVYGTQEIENFTNVSGKLFFSFRTYFDNVPPADELWICDGTEAGTKMLKSFSWSPHMYKSEMGMFFAFQGKLFFRGGDPVNRALWTSNGTTEGTIKFHDVILTPPYNDERTPVLVTENKIFFSGSNPNGYNAELWSSNGTPEGTKQIFDLTDEGGSTPHDFSISNEVLYFVTSEQFSATLWSTAPAADISVTGSQGNNLISGSKPFLFYEVPKGGCKTTDIVIRNKGLEELYLSKIFITGNDFYLVKKSFPETIAPGESVTIQLLFNPVSEGISKSTLTILSSDTDEAKYVVYLEATPSANAGKEICQFSDDNYVKSLRPTEIPGPIMLSSSSIAEGQPLGTIVGSFTLPAGATFTLTAGEGDINNQDFFIEGNQLKSNGVFNFDLKTVYSIRVKAILQGVESETSLRIHVINASSQLKDESCQPVFERMSFAYTSLEANAEGHLFATTSNGQILRSKNSGRNWDVVFTTKNYSRLSGITFKGLTGYAQGSNIMLKSEDGGATWFRLFIPQTGTYYFSDFGMFFLNEKEGYVGTEEGEVFFTSDGGRTWETRMQGSWYEFRKLYFLSKDRGYATLGWGDLVQTSDGGRSWTAVDLSALEWNPRVQDLWFKNDSDGFLVGQYKFYKTTDGGLHWSEIPNISVGDVMRIKFINDSMGFLYGANGILSRTTNGGDTWEQSFPSVWPGQVCGIAQSSGKLFIATKNYFYNYETARGFAVSADQGSTWTTLSYFGDGNLYRIEFPVANKGIVIGAEGIFKTEDNGLTWNQTVSDLTSVGDMHFIDENTVILVSGGHIYKSTDGGITTRNVLTTEQGEHYLPAGKLYSFQGNILFAVSWYAIYRSDDLGETWEMISTNPGYYTQGMHFVSSSVGYRVELFGSIEKTIDGGKTWVEIFTRDPSASTPFNALFFINETLGYKGGNVLQRTTDGGISWEKVDWPFYEIIAIHFENKDHGYVVTRGGYVYETNDEGTTWQTILFGSNSIADAQFRNHEIFLVGENGFVVRLNSTPSGPSLPGYIYGPDKVCVGDASEFHLAVDSDYHTQWNTTAGNIEDHNEYVTVNFPEPGEYTITARHFNSCGVGGSRTTTVMVAEPPAVPVIEGPNPATSGEDAVAYSVINATADDKFLWEVEGSSGSSIVENGILIDWASNTEDGEIQVLAVDAYGCRNYGVLKVALEAPLAAENNLLNDVSLYPNPTETDTKIVSSHVGLIFVRIIDLVGKEYCRTTLSGRGEQTMLTRQLPSGLYLVEISDGQHSVTKKLIRK